MNIYKRILKYVPEKKWSIILSIVFAMCSSILIVGISYYIYQFTYALLNSNYDLCIQLGKRILWMLLVGNILYFIGVLFSHAFAFRLETNLKKYGIDCITKASTKFFDQHASGALRKTIDDNTLMTHSAVAHLIPDSAKLLGTTILIYVIGFKADIKLGILLLAFTVISMLLVKKMTGNQTFMKEYMKALDEMSNEAVEYVRGLPVIKIFNSSITSFETFYRTINDYSKLALNYTMSCKKWYTLFLLLFFASPAYLTIYAVYAYNEGIEVAYIISILVLAILLIGLIFSVFMQVMYTGMYITQASTCLNNLESLYSNMEENELVHGTVTDFSNYNINFDHVSFGYNENDLILNDLSFQLDENKVYALTGRSGSGKTTIAKLLSGFYNLNGGTIQIGGIPLHNYSEKALNQAIAFVFQDTKLFETSIYENVHIGNPNASYEEVMNALHLAMCDPIIDALSERENTVIGAKGVHLSGGEKQRIAIARAILKDAKIIILDEASAATDPECEYEMLLAFKNLMKDKTVIMIAHRLTTIKGVDEILVIDDGTIVERGNDDELMQQKGLYYKLQTLYAKANDWRVKHD